MPDRYFNPFQGIDVSIPVEFGENISRYSQREGKAIIDQSPFPRMVDMWFLAVCIAARDGLSLPDTGNVQTRKIIEGSIFSSDPWRVHTLMLIAIAHTQSVEIVSEPRRMMAIANGLAVAGLPRVLAMMREGDGEPIWNLSDSIETLISKTSAA